MPMAQSEFAPNAKYGTRKESIRHEPINKLAQGFLKTSAARKSSMPRKIFS